MVAALPGERDLLEQAFLEGLRPKLDWAHHERDVVVIRSSRLLSEHVSVVGDEVAAVPVALEHRGDFVDDVGVAGAGDANVPLQACDLRGVGQIRGADVGRRESGLTVEQPRLRVQARAGDVVGHSDVRAKVTKRIERGAFRRVRVGRRQHSQASARRTMRSKRPDQGSDAALPNERHHHVDPVRGVHFGEDLASNPGLSGCVREQRGVEKRNERMRDDFAASIGQPARYRAQDAAGKALRPTGQVGWRRSVARVDRRDRPRPSRARPPERPRGPFAPRVSRAAQCGPRPRRTAGAR